MALKSNILDVNRSIDNAIKSEYQSKMFFKKVVPITIGFILHQRINYDRDDFFEVGYQDISYSVLKKKLKNQTLIEIRKAVQDAMRALDNNWLQELFLLFVSPLDKNSVYEYYTFKFCPTKSMKPILDNRRLLHFATYKLLKKIGDLNEAFQPEDINVKFVMTFYTGKVPRSLPFKALGLANDPYTQNLLSNLDYPNGSLETLKTGHHKLKMQYSSEMTTSQEIEEDDMLMDCFTINDD